MPPPPAEHLAARIFMGPALRAQPDRRLVDLVRDGYDAAFEEIVRRYRHPLDRFAAAIVGGRFEDVTQDAFSKALLALRGSEAEIELRPWLYRIVRNTALNDLRDRAPAAAELSETLPGARSAAAEVEAREELRDLMTRLQALPETQRAALVMRELEGLGHEEIAAALGVSGGAARQAIFRARATLREGFGLLVPLPVLRALADHGAEAGAAGGAVALGGGALKAGMATMLIAGAVGTGVAVEHHRGDAGGPAAAKAAPLVRAKQRGTETSGRIGAESSSHIGGDDSEQGGGRGGGDRGSDDRSSAGSGSSGEGGRSGSGASSDSGDASRLSGTSPSGSGASGPGPSPSSGSGEDSGSGDRRGDRSGSSSDDLGSGSDDSGGSSGGSGPGSSESDDGLTSGGDGSSSGPGGGEIESESEPTAPVSEPTLSEDSSGSGSGSSGGSSGQDSGTSGSGDLSTSSGGDSGTGSDGSP